MKRKKENAYAKQEMQEDEIYDTFFFSFYLLLFTEDGLHIYQNNSIRVLEEKREYKQVRQWIIRIVV